MIHVELMRRRGASAPRGDPSRRDSGVQRLVPLRRKGGPYGSTLRRDDLHRRRSVIYAMDAAKLGGDTEAMFLWGVASTRAAGALRHGCLHRRPGTHVLAT